MKLLLLNSALGLLLVGSASCSSGDKAMERPTRFSNTSVKRSNDKSRSYKNRGPIGLGVDLNANDPQKFRMVDAPKKYKYKKPRQ
ncbi:hypothetical protein [Hymenobacter terrestris]|uniref:Quinol oxidase subunit 4 n=1 Tax=Hymenobacter terrestris TaxID=2748310 RepID=A0ABX2Q161_9BACT|nr:hypothetical protein [Hymenobacter terrestris]NVO84146.1 hypothetical protein [Hymenobacter terrestris]